MVRPGRARRATSSRSAGRSAAGSCGTRVETEPLMLIAGGSGLVPLMSMLRHRRNAGSEVPAKLLRLRARGRRRPLRARARDDRRRGRAHLHAPAAPRTGRLRAPRRPRDAAGDRAARRRARTSAARPRSWRPWPTTSSRSARHRPNIRTERFGALEADDGASRRQRGRGRAVRGLRTRCRRRRSRPAPAAATTGPWPQAHVYEARHGHRAALPGVRRACCCATCARADELRWRCAASGSCAGEASRDDAARVALEDLPRPSRGSAAAAPRPTARGRRRSRSRPASA